MGLLKELVRYASIGRWLVWAIRSFPLHDVRIRRLPLRAGLLHFRALTGAIPDMHLNIECATCGRDEESVGGKQDNLI